MSSATPFRLEAVVLLLGLSDEVAIDLTKSLNEISESLTVSREPLTELEQAARAGLVFCPPDPRLIEDLRRASKGVRVIAVSRLAEVCDWLDAMEAGAHDYCAAPFEPSQVRWLLESSLRYSQAAAA